MRFVSAFDVIIRKYGTKKKAATANPLEAEKQAMIGNLDKRFDEYAKISKQIWDYAELGYMEEKSSLLLQEQLKKRAFRYKQVLQGYQRPL
jgi:aminobenzoyl-glutamate utilization protein B